MDPNVHPDWYYDRHKHHNAEMKPQLPYYSTHGPFIGHRRPAMTSPTGRAHRPSPRICDDQFVRAASSQRSNKPSGFFHASNEEDEHRGMRTIGSYENSFVRAGYSQRSGELYEENGEDELYEVMRVDSYEEYPSYSNQEPEPHSSQEEIKIEDPLQNSLNTQEGTTNGAVKGQVEAFLEEIKDQILETESIYSPEEAVRACKIFLEMARHDGTIINQPLTQEEEKIIGCLARLNVVGTLDEERKLLQHLREKGNYVSKRIGKIFSCYLQVIGEERGYLKEEEVPGKQTYPLEEDHGRHVLKEEREETLVDQTFSQEEDEEDETILFNVVAHQSPKEPPWVNGEPEKMSKSPPHNQPPSLRCESLRPHRRAPGMRQPDPRPHGRDSAMRPDPSPHPNPDDSPPHNQASSVRQDLSWPHTRDLIVRPVTCSTPSFDSKILSPNEGPRPMSPTNVTSHHHGDGGNSLEESITLVVKSPNELQERKGEETEVLYQKGNLLQNFHEKGNSISINTCKVPSCTLQETEERETIGEAVWESRRTAKQGQLFFEESDHGSSRGEEEGHSPSTCNPKIFPIQEDHQREASKEERELMIASQAAEIAELPPHDHGPDMRRSPSRPHGRITVPRQATRWPYKREPSPWPVTDSFLSGQDMILSPSITTSRDHDKLQGHTDLKPYVKEEPSFMVTCYTAASLQPQALQDQEEKLVKRKREAKEPRPKEFYKGRKTLEATDHSESREWTYGEPFSEKQIDFKGGSNEVHLENFSKDAEISSLFTDGEDEKGSREAYLYMTTQAPQEEFRRNIAFRRIRERREAPDQGNFRPRPPPFLYHPYGDSRPAPKPHPSRFHSPDPQTDECDQNFFKRSRVSFSLSHQPLQDITNGIPRHESQGERFETSMTVRIRVAGHDTTKKQEKEPDPMVVCNPMTHHKSHPLRALEKGEINKEEGDPPYKIIEEELRGLNKARPKKARHRISSPSA